MYNRDYKIFGKDGYFHVFNRGNAKMDIFKDDNDYKAFLFRLKENLFPEKVPESARKPLTSHSYVRKLLPSGAFSLLAYCLMPNHFHLLLRQNAGLTISKLMLKVCGGYSKIFNKKYNRIGSLFQDQYKTVRVETDSQLLWLSSYIHNNPKTAGLVKESEDWQWSSYPDYIGLRQGILADKSFVLGMVNTGLNQYQKFVLESFEKIEEKKDLEYLLLDN